MSTVTLSAPTRPSRFPNDRLQAAYVNETGGAIGDSYAEGNDLGYALGYDDGLAEAEQQLLPKIQMAQTILKACIEIERTVNGSVQNEYRDLINVPRPFTGNSTIVQDAKDLANAITPGTCP